MHECWAVYDEEGQGQAQPLRDGIEVCAPEGKLFKIQASSAKIWLPTFIFYLATFIFCFPITICDPPPGTLLLTHA
jgi:hypothetical protein